MQGCECDVIHISGPPYHIMDPELVINTCITVDALYNICQCIGLMSISYGNARIFHVVPSAWYSFTPQKCTQRFWNLFTIAIVRIFFCNILSNQSHICIVSYVVQTMKKKVSLQLNASHPMCFMRTNKITVLPQWVGSSDVCWNDVPVSCYAQSYHVHEHLVFFFCRYSMRKEMLKESMRWNLQAHWVMF